MADVHTQSCDVCGILKRETNHWFKGFRQGWDKGVSVIPMNVMTDKPDAHLCGTACALKWVSKELQNTSWSNNAEGAGVFVKA